MRICHRNSWRVNRAVDGEILYVISALRNLSFQPIEAHPLSVLANPHQGVETTPLTMSAADPDDDVYASDDYEPESPTRSQQSPTHSQRSASPSPVAQQQQLAFQLDADELENDESDAGAVTPLPRSEPNRSRKRRESDAISGRQLMDNTPWTYTVSALQVRMLRIPVSESAAIRELRVFATIDKQAAQSKGSRWKQESQPTGAGSPFRSKSSGRNLPERWIKLQNSPFGGEILISSSFSPKGMQALPTRENLKEHINGLLSKTSTAPAKGIGAVPTVVSVDAGEYLQIGDGNGQEIFVLSVFIQQAINLSNVVEVAIGGSPEEMKQAGFWLSYSLFDVVVQTDVFYNLSFAEFSPIRDSFRVKGSLADLRRCIETLGSLTVFMCTENRVLAGVEIPLRPLLSNELFASSALKGGSTSNVRGLFSFPDFDDAVITASVDVDFVESKQSEMQRARLNNEVDNAKQTTATIVENTNREGLEYNAKADESLLKGDIDAHEPIVLKLDHLRLKQASLVQFTGEEGVSVEIKVGDESAHGELVFCSYTKHHALATSPGLGLVLKGASSQVVLDAPIRVQCSSSISNVLIASSTEITSVIQDEEGCPKTIVLSMLSQSSQPLGQCTISCTQDPAAIHQLDRELLRDASGNMHLYRVFNGDWFSVQNKGEVEICDFYCYFDLLKDSLQLKNEMQESVNIDLISSEQESLSYLYFSEEHYCCAENKCEEVFVTQEEAEAHWLEVHTDLALPETQTGTEAYSHLFRSCSINIPVVKSDSATTGQSRRTGSVRVSAYLEDIGLFTEKSAITRNENMRNTTTASSTSVEAAPVKDTRERSSSTTVLREAEKTSHYAAQTKESPAVNSSAENFSTVENDAEQRRQKEAAVVKETLEREKNVWKQEQHLQQLQWKRRFAEMEKARMDELEEEWARREEERSNLLKSAQEEYQRLEQTLRKSLADMETRERRLAIAEAALQREKEATRDENESLRRRLKSEQNHTLSLAKKQTEAYERRISLLETQLSDAERRAKQVETDFVEYRQQQRKLPESRLREEIAALKGSVAELEKQKMAKDRECEVAEANVQKLKIQLDQMANLLTQEKKKHEARVVDELEKLRVKYIAREEKYVLDGDRDELRAIKKQLDDLKGFNTYNSGGRRRSRRSRSRESTSQHYKDQRWHTQSRQTNLIYHSRSAHQQEPPPAGPSFYSKRASEDGSDWETQSYIEAGRTATAPLDMSPDEYTARPRSQESVIEEAPVIANEDDGSLQMKMMAQNISLSDAGNSNSELGRLLRERKLLLASGAYDAESYLVRELDRLIRVTKAYTEHQSSLA
ncbi:unnamed protein product [Phytophthora lilii]|uniref:Unnamed protein product n=1 Tax=Phytophthora lilii TaxID=2077276 RepID=A0A9W6X8C9_9STRA|nr:unnamed protein product [Phytophthora lilii]